jgi:LPXTG-motif cell wall-anchored protein
MVRAHFPTSYSNAGETNMDSTTILIIILVILVLGGGGFYGRGRWW